MMRRVTLPKQKMRCRNQVRKQRTIAAGHPGTQLNHPAGFLVDAQFLEIKGLLQHVGNGVRQVALQPQPIIEAKLFHRIEGEL